jgi:hypothetical protein
MPSSQLTLILSWPPRLVAFALAAHLLRRLHEKRTMRESESQIGNPG